MNVVYEESKVMFHVKHYLFYYNKKCICYRISARASQPNGKRANPAPYGKKIQYLIYLKNKRK